MFGNINNAYNYISIEWLKTGDGEMLKDSNSNMNVGKPNNELQIDVILKAFEKLAESVLNNSEANKDNAAANRQYSKNMDRMLDILQNNGLIIQSKEKYMGNLLNVKKEMQDSLAKS